MPDASQLLQAKEEHKGAPLAIWLGILIDGIPESFVIGSGLLVLLKTKVQLIDSISFGDVIPFTLIAGLFLSNFPEALASSANMLKDSSPTSNWPKRCRSAQARYAIGSASSISLTSNSGALFDSILR